MNHTETKQVLDTLRAVDRTENEFDTLINAGHESLQDHIDTAIAICEASLARVNVPVKNLREILSAAIASEIAPCGYDCTRVWEAWHVGTMSQDDFEPMIDRLDDIVETVARAIEAAPQEAAAPGWVPVEDRLPDCDMTPNSLGMQVLVHPPYQSEGSSDMHAAFYGCRQTDEPNFYMFGRVFTPTHWQPIPTPPKATQ